MITNSSSQRSTSFFHRLLAVILGRDSALEVKARELLTAPMPLNWLATFGSKERTAL